jgi:hypothetical protein
VALTRLASVAALLVSTVAVATTAGATQIIQSLSLGQSTLSTSGGSYVTPANTCTVVIQAKGGNGGTGWTGSDAQGGTSSGGAGGVGGYVDSIVHVGAGVTLGVTVGQAGTNGSLSGVRSAGGAGAGPGGISGRDTYTSRVTAGGGGGASQVVANGTILAVAGGGGGGVTLDDGVIGGPVSSLAGGAGGAGANASGSSGAGVNADTFAAGGTLSAPGAGGVFVSDPRYNFSGNDGSPGSGNTGGAAGDGEDVAGGGGGGGYFGGGGGAASGSGAGGSSYVLNPSLDSILSWTSPASQAAGEVILTPEACPAVAAPPMPASPPSSLTVTGGVRSVTATWDMPLPAPTSYECVLSLGGHDVATTTSVTYLYNTLYQCRFSGLQDATTYGVSVIAFNDVGPSWPVTDYATTSHVHRYSVLCVKGSVKHRVWGAPPRCPPGYVRH